MTAASRPSRLELAKPRGSSLVRLPLVESDAAIVGALRAGQQVGGAALYDRYHTHVRRVLTRVLGPDAELGDLVQDVFVEAIDSIDRLEEPAALRGWLATIAVFRARGEIRRRTRSRWFPLFSSEQLPDVAAPVSTPEVDEAVRATYRILAKLSADERIVFALRFVDGMQVAEVAEVCRVSLATVKRRLTRAQKRFVAIARNVPEVSDWLGEGARWT
jgi:RNA polymerase sigma-70 factor, ECF subfamily